MLAFHLAETISALFRHVLDHPSKVLYDPETEPLFLQGRPRIAKPRMMKENGAKKRTAHTGSFRQQTQRAWGDAKKTMLRNCLDYFKESTLSWKPPLPPRLLTHYSLVLGGVIRLNLVVEGVIRLNNNSIYLKPDDLVLLLAECTASATPPPFLLRGLWQNVCFPLGKWTFLWPHLRSSCGVVRSRDIMVYIWIRMISYYYWRNAAHPLFHSSVAFEATPSSHAAAPTSDTLTDTLAHHHGPAFTPSHCFHFTMPSHLKYKRYADVTTSTHTRMASK